MSRKLNLRLGYLERIPNMGWYALRAHEYLGKLKRFDDLGAALEYLGYEPAGRFTDAGYELHLRPYAPEARLYSQSHAHAGERGVTCNLFI